MNSEGQVTTNCSANLLLEELLNDNMLFLFVLATNVLASSKVYFMRDIFDIFFIYLLSMIFNFQHPLDSIVFITAKMGLHGKSVLLSNLPGSIFVSDLFHRH
jgi:hypothetical protein